MKKLSLVLSAMLILSGCGPQMTTPTPVPSKTAIPSTSGTPLPSTTPTPAVTPSVSSTPSVSPSPVVTPTPLPTPTPVQTPNPFITRNNKVSLGIQNAFINVTDELVSDYQKESRDVATDILELNPSFVVIDLNQKIVDPKYEVDKNFLQWQVYDDLISKLKDKNIEIFFKLNHNIILSEQSSPKISKFTEFLQKVIERYSDSKISWIIGEKINDKNVIPGTQEDYLNFLQISYNTIKRTSPDSTVYLGSIRQSEVFSQTSYFAVDNFLSYLNLGADKYCDGFIFEVNSLDVQSNEFVNSSAFTGTNYKLIGNYYDYVTELLNKKNLTNKKLMLISDTYGGELVNNLNQTELQQANDIFRRIVYGISKGFDRVYLPEFIDESILAPSDFYKRLGLIKKDNDIEDRKTAYWTYKFISEKLRDATYKSTIAGLPSNLEGFIFEKDNKTLYILWNNDPKFTGNIPLIVKSKQGTINISPGDESRVGTSVNFDLNVSESDKVNVAFNVNNLNPRIVEVNN